MSNAAEAYFESLDMCHPALSARYVIEADTSDDRLYEIAYRMRDEADAELDVHECLAVAEAVRDSQRTFPEPEENAMRDSLRTRLVFVVYDTSRTNSTATGDHRVATFRHEANAQRFVDDAEDPKLYVSCQSEARRDLTLFRD